MLSKAASCRASSQGENQSQVIPRKQTRDLRWACILYLCKGPGGQCDKIDTTCGCDEDSCYASSRQCFIASHCVDRI